MRAAFHFVDSLCRGKSRGKTVFILPQTPGIFTPKINMPNTKNQRNSIVGWYLYDWANQSYILTVATAVLPAYFAGAVVPAGGWRGLGPEFSASALWGYAVSLSAAITFVTAPVLGAAADHLGAKKRFLAACCLGGCLATAGLGLCGPGDVLPVLGLFILAQSLYAAGNVFYDGFIPELAPEGGMDALSSRGFAFGYAGGALHFMLCLGFMALSGHLGLTKGEAARWAIVSAAVWWGGFFLFPLRMLRERPGGDSGVSFLDLARIGVRRTLCTLGEISRRPRLRRFLLAYLLYNDGVQTVIAMAAIYGKEELGLSETWLMATLLAVQFVALAGALAFSRLASRIGARRAVMVSLAIWTGVAGYAALIHTAWQYLVLGLLVGLVLGGTQALSRSMYAAMIPADSPARYFGFFSVVTKFSAVLGPFIFGLVRQMTGSCRPAVPVMAVFFLLGMLLLARTGREQGSA